MARQEIPEVVYLGRDNAFQRVLTQLVNGVQTTADLSSVSRMTLTLGSTVLDSLNNPSYFSWKNQPIQGTVLIKLGGAALVPGLYTAELVVYDSANPDGVVWDTFPVDVRPS